MASRVGYTKQQLLEVFQEIGPALPRQLVVYLFGGGAMAFRDQKAATKDLDLAFLSHVDYKTFAEAMAKIGFHKVKFLEKAYEEMEASGICERQDGFRIDMFVKVICNNLEVTPAMQHRCQQLGDFGKLTVKMLCNEDVVLLKGITERDSDTEDIVRIIELGGVDWNVILQECISQSGERVWFYSLVAKLYKIKEKGIDSPILGQLEELSNRATIIQGYRNKRDDGKTHDEALAALKIDEFTDEELEQLEWDLKKGKIELK